MLKQKKIKVLIVDDSAIVRKILSEELSKDREIEVLGTAPDPFIARDKLLKLNPDVITLDLEMPRMDGLTFLQKIMKYNPLPVIIVSSLTKNGSDKAIKALELGAVDVLGKPGGAYSVGEMKMQLVEKVKAAYKISFKKPEKEEAIEEIEKRPSSIDNFKFELTKLAKIKLIAIGASTGGTEAIKKVIYELPPTIPGVVIVQHMPPNFTKSFADRLNAECELYVKEAENLDRIETGKVLIAPGGYHMIVKRNVTGYYVEVKDGPLVNHQKPSVDVLFRSVATTVPNEAIGVILTGMGRDGAAGMLEMNHAGIYNIAQDESSCVVFGMPKEAISNGSVDVISSVSRIPNEIIKYINKFSS